MSLFGFKIQISDNFTALSYPVRVILYRSDYNLQQINIENLKSLLKSTVTTTDIWWASKPYLRIVTEKDREEIFMRQYKCQRVDPRGKDKAVMLIDLCHFTGESVSRFSRARDLDSEIEKVYITEDAFRSSTLITPC